MWDFNDYDTEALEQVANALSILATYGFPYGLDPEGTEQLFHELEERKSKLADPDYEEEPIMLV